jgi:hypothetical protein
MLHPREQLQRQQTEESREVEHSGQSPFCGRFLKRLPAVRPGLLKSAGPSIGPARRRAPLVHPGFAGGRLMPATFFCLAGAIVAA